MKAIYVMKSKQTDQQHRLRKQAGKLGPASAVRRVDPLTGQVIGIIMSNSECKRKWLAKLKRKQSAERHDHRT
jgi:hypothetical protein